jgi:hypothetical protein
MRRLCLRRSQLESNLENLYEPNTCFAGGETETDLP